MSFILKAVLFDLDGVLVNSPLDLPAIKRELFGDSSVFIIEGLEACDETEREKKSVILLERELEAASKATADPAVPQLFEWLENRNIKRAVITRNSRKAVKLISDNLGLDFGIVIAREDAPPKPDPGSVFAACERLGISPESCVMVGDFAFDIEAGKSAGCRTVFIETEKFHHLQSGEDARISNLSELIGVLENWLDEKN